MKQLILMSLIVCACSNTQVMAIESPHELKFHVNDHVTVHLRDGENDNAEQVSGKLQSLSGEYVAITLDSTGKLYFYPMRRVSGLEAL